jgi:hypothetical protein
MGRTIADWVACARRAERAEERARCLDEAIARAARVPEWRALLAGIGGLEPLDAGRLAAVAQRTLEAAAAERDVWGFRDVAAMRAGRLGDRDGARMALADGARALRDPAAGRGPSRGPVRGHEWALLGQGFAETLGDADGLRRCLDLGAEAARAAGDAGELSRIAVAWAKVDRAAGIALVREAERLEGGGSPAFAAWNAANAWHELGETAEAARVLDAAEAGAATVEAALTLARAWASHGQPARAEAALSRAESLATDLAGWLAIVEAAHDAGLGAPAIRRALARAEALAGDAQARAQVSRGYRLWLGDGDAAARLGPRGLPPARLRRPARTLAGWAASPSALLDWLRARVPEETLRRIAEADYGDSADVHLAALQDICETGLLPPVLPWEPHEVLALCRWEEGEGIDHLERALCAALLCLAPGDLDELITDGPILVESCLALGPEAGDGCEQLLAWRWETDAPEADWGDEIDPERPVALLLLLVLRAARAPDDPRLEALARALTAEAGGDLETLAGGLAGGMRLSLWDELVERALGPLRARPVFAALLAGLGR